MSQLTDSTLPHDDSKTAASAANTATWLQKVQSDKLGITIGPYKSQAVKTIKPIKGWIFVAGQVPVLPGHVVFKGSAADKTHLMCRNTRNVLEAAGSSLDKVVKVTIYFTDITEYEESNAVYAQYFPHCPPRVCVEVSKLPEEGLTMQLDVTAVEVDE